MSEERVRTGFEGIEVCPVPDPSNTILRPNLTSNQLASLAREMAMNVREEHIVLRSYGISRDQFEAWCQKHPFYIRCYETFVVEWNSALSTKKRIEIESAAALEDTLPGLAHRMQDAKEPLNQATETAKLFARLAGAGETKNDGGGSGERFTITINLAPDDVKVIEAHPQTSAPVLIPSHPGSEKTNT